eukprot:7098787-Pyramimonas_sp.AAC.1
MGMPPNARDASPVRDCLVRLRDLPRLPWAAADGGLGPRAGLDLLAGVRSRGAPVEDVEDAH